MSKTLCYIFTAGSKYKKLARCAGASFKKWHPHIDVRWEHFDQLSRHQLLIGPVIKYLYAYNAAVRGKYDKLIALGADTITCSVLDEFINNKEDILCTLDYPYQLKTKYVKTPEGDFHVNADVICFNNLNALKDIIQLTTNCPTIYNEQGALNQLLYNYDHKHNYTYKIVDAPYTQTYIPTPAGVDMYAASNVIYNARAKGNITAKSGTKPWKEYTLQFKVINNKLLSYDDKHIKVWHYCDGLGGLSDREFKKIINFWISEWFNNETKQFFTSQCNCKDFFYQEFTY